MYEKLLRINQEQEDSINKLCSILEIDINCEYLREKFYEEETITQYKTIEKLEKELIIKKEKLKNLQNKIFNYIEKMKEIEVQIQKNENEKWNLFEYMQNNDKSMNITDLEKSDIGNQEKIHELRQIEEKIDEMKRKIQSIKIMIEKYESDNEILKNFLNIFN